MATPTPRPVPAQTRIGPGENGSPGVEQIHVALTRDQVSAPVPAPAPAPASAPAPDPSTPRPAPAKPAARAAAAPATKPSRLGAVKRGLLVESKRFLFYGPEGIGKSSLLSDVDDLLLMDMDRGSGHLDVPRYQFRDDAEGHVPRDLDEVYAGIDDLLLSPHSFKALGIDTSDSLEALIWKKVCERAGVNRNGDRIDNIEDFGFGRGYNVAADEWRKLLHRLDQLRLRRGMHIVFAGHVLVKTFKNPEGEDYDRYRPKLDDRALGLLREWCEVVGLVTFDDIAKKNKGATRARGISTGLRIIKLEHNAAWDAKCRLPLPAQIELSLERPWSPFREALETLTSATPDGTRDKINAELARLGDVGGTGTDETGEPIVFLRADGKESNAVAVRAHMASAGDDVATLSKYLIVLNQSQPKEVNP